MPRYIDAENIRYTTEQPYKSVVRRVIIQQPTAPAIDPADDDFGVVLNCAVRYAIGRHASYMPRLVIDFITPLLPRLSNSTLECLARDVDKEARRDRLGDPKVDAPAWLRFLEAVRGEMEMRNKVAGEEVAVDPRQDARGVTP